MHRLNWLESDQWSLLDECDQEVFRGTLAGCEAWLDRQENLRGSDHLGPFSDFDLRDWIRQSLAETRLPDRSGSE